MTRKIEYKDLELPNYVNSREVFAGLDVGDLAKAAVLGQLNLLVVGDTGTGKTQLASDIFRAYFGGNKASGGHGIFVRAHPDVDIYHEVFTSLNLSRAQRELTGNLEAMVYFVDEINRAPPIAQNQFFGLGDGKMDFGGREIWLGRDGYHVLLATANIGNGEFQGTFDTDKALYNRMHVALDLEHRAFQPTFEDLHKIRSRKANPNVASSKEMDISGEITEISREISERTENPGPETQAALNYLATGLQNCQRYGSKDRIWPMGCQDCKFNKDGNALCANIKNPTTRTLEVVRKYAEALKFLAELKNPSATNFRPHEYIFKAFELAGAYQHLLNSSRLRENFNHNPKLMAEVVEKLRADYEANMYLILTSIDQAHKGKEVTRFFEFEGEIGDYDSLTDQGKKKTSMIAPFTNSREIGLSWVEDAVDMEIKKSGQ